MGIDSTATQSVAVTTVKALAASALFMPAVAGINQPNMTVAQ